MNIKRRYNKPDIEEHYIDKGVVYLFGSPPLPPKTAPQEPAPMQQSAPDYQNPPAQDYPFGNDSPDFSNM
ncbi:hypothetical protein KDU71_12060 [Carboxylicivirga sediminis]|uniref:Uncharacterized protein n=1 Tax=Carboxylicivirga sediminis TaxID=2006564 RepID=A0A941IX09_9BACT|nr:hypothetical protein [Carboxylicivirga sediminis]MBR8536296.1 hypothetical protein [Carboxylicivirga sediminis]